MALVALAWHWYGISGIGMEILPFGIWHWHLYYHSSVIE
jgi:hypothetical protein